VNGGCDWVYRVTEPQTRLERVDDGRAVVLRVDGEIDLATVDVLRDGLTDALAQNVPLVVVDLEAVGFLGSVGLSALIGAHEKATQSGCRLVVAVSATRPAMRTIHVTGLTELLSVTESVESAISPEPGDD
jgi:anti-anti-sigma factor